MVGGIETALEVPLHLPMVASTPASPMSISQETLDVVPRFLENTEVSPVFIEASGASRNADAASSNIEASVDEASASSPSVAASAIAAANIEVSAADIEVSAANIEVSAANIEVSAANIEVSAANIEGSAALSSAASPLAKDGCWWQERGRTKSDGSQPNRRPDPPQECCICGAPPKMMDHTCIACTATTCSGCVVNLRHLACPYCHDIEGNAKALRNEAMTIKAINKASEWFSAAKTAFRDVADNVLERTKMEPPENASWRKSYESDYAVEYPGFGIGSSNRKN